MSTIQLIWHLPDIGMICGGFALIILGLIRTDDIPMKIALMLLGISIIVVMIATWDSVTDEEIERMSDYW